MELSQDLNDLNKMLKGTPEEPEKGFIYQGMMCFKEVREMGKRRWTRAQKIALGKIDKPRQAALRSRKDRDVLVETLRHTVKEYPKLLKRLASVNSADECARQFNLTRARVYQIWGAVERLGTLLKKTPQKIASLAESNGLPVTLRQELSSTVVDAKLVSPYTRRKGRR